MDHEQIMRCRQRIAEEERNAQEAPYDEAAELHRQKAKLYRTQLGILEQSWDGVPVRMQQGR